VSKAIAADISGGISRPLLPGTFAPALEFMIGFMIEGLRFRMTR